MQEVFNSVSQVLIEECLLGWYEFEYEIVRDFGEYSNYL